MPRTPPTGRSGIFGGVPANSILPKKKIRIVLAGLRGEESIAAQCRREGIAESLYYSWSKEFLEAGKRRLAGDTERQANSGEVKELRGITSTPDEPHPPITGKLKRPVHSDDGHTEVRRVRRGLGVDRHPGGWRSLRRRARSGTGF